MADCLASIGSKYQLVRTELNPGGPGPILVVRSNPKRWSLTFSVATNHVIHLDTTEQPAAGQGIWLTLGSPLVFKFRDHPVLTTTDWYGNFPAFGDILTIYEEIFIG